MKIKHVISTKQFTDRKELEAIFALADHIHESDDKGMPPHSLRGKILACLFYEPSTRTRFSFEAAMQKLGGGIITAENAAVHSSAVKGETLEDTIKIVSGYADAIVLRHFEEGSAKRAATVSPIPLISAGDGAGEHPTQALLDVYTMKKELGRLDNLNIALIGDLFYGRTIHSLFPLLALLKNIKVFLISPEELRVPQKYRDYLKEIKIPYKELTGFDSVLQDADVLYVTRIQKERFKNPADYEKMKDSFVINNKVLKKVKKGAIILHPLPRVNEIAPEVDHDVRAAYFRQAKNGLYLRMALLQMLVLGK